MNILLISDTLHAGGAETFVLRLATKLNQLGVKAEILSLNPDFEDKALINNYPSIPIHRINLPGLRWIKRIDRALRIAGINFSLQNKLNKQIILKKYLKYDVYHTHLFPVDYLFSQIKKLYPTMVVISTLHGDYNEFEELWQENNGSKKLNWPAKVNFVNSKMNGWVFISKQQYNLFSKQYLIPENKLFQIYNGYESANTFPKNDKNFDKKKLTFIMVARGIQPKGWDYLLKAFSSIKGKHQLILVGKGEYLEGLKDNYQQDSRIKFIGFHPNPITLINEADIFVFPSVYKAESLPTVIIEALYCGLPVISTKIGEVPEMLIGNDKGDLAGLLIDNKDEETIVTNMVEAMNLYINNFSLLEHHSELALNAYEKFKMDVCTIKYINLYRKFSNN